MKITKLLASTMALAGVLFAYVAPAVNAKTLSVVSGLPRNHDQVETYFRDFHQPLNAAKGPIKLNYKGGPEVTPRKQQGNFIKRGLIDLLISPSSYYAGQVPESRVTAISNRAPWEIRKTGGMETLSKGWEKGIGARILAWPFWGGSNFHVYLTKKPALSKETGVSLSGQKMRATSLYIPFLKAMGATPVVISPGDVYTALQRGVVTGLAWPEGAVTKYGWQEYIKYRVGPGFWRSSTMLVMNQKKWSSLSKSEKDFVMKFALAFEKASGKTLRKIANKDNAKIFAAGVEKMELEGDYAKAWLNTINGSTWDDAKKRKMTVPYETIRKIMYKE